MSRKKHKIRSPRDTLQKTCAISHLFRVDGSLQRETSRPMEIENISTKLDNKVFILFLILLLTLSISQLVPLLSSKQILTYTGNELENIGI